MFFDEANQAMYGAKSAMNQGKCYLIKLNMAGLYGTKSAMEKVKSFCGEATHNLHGAKFALKLFFD